MSKKWLSTKFRASKPERVDAEKGIIYGASLNTVGEAKGHGVFLDQEFVNRVALLAQEKPGGLKARFGHPNMCSTAMGTFLGRWKNFRVDGEQARADLYLSNASKDTPNGNLRDYVLSMASEEADMFGTSIVFSAGREYQRNDEDEKVFDDIDDSQPVFVEIKALHAADIVDDPAANEGMFSAFSGETLAGQVTQFLDENPQIFEAIKDNTELFGAIASHSDNFNEFVQSYEQYKSEANAMTKDNEVTTEEELVDLEVALEEQTEDLTALEDVETVEEVEVSTDAPEEVVVDDPTEPEDEPLASNTIERDEFNRSLEEFGAQITAEAFKEGGGYTEAKELYFATILAENEILKKRNEELSRAEVDQSGKAAEFVTVPEKTRKGIFSDKLYK